jgi:biopolymer transport protein ExbD
MAMSVGGADDDAPMSEINTTPLVDVMLVLLIIFLITIPVITKTIKLNLPQAVNVPNETKPENITLAIDKNGKIYWNEGLVPTREALLERIKAVTIKASKEGKTQPEFQIRADKQVRYEAVGRVIVTAQQAGVAKLGFITEPDRAMVRTTRAR